MEVIAIKIHHNNQSKLYPLKLRIFEYDDVNKIHDKSKVVAAIKETLEFYGIAPNASDFEYDEPQTIYVLTNVVTDGAYLQAKSDNDDVLVESIFKEELDLGPMFAGWELDPSHEIETVRKHTNKKSYDVVHFIQIIKNAYDILLCPKWSTTLKNVAKKKKYPIQTIFKIKHNQIFPVFW